MSSKSAVFFRKGNTTICALFNDRDEPIAYGEAYLKPGETFDHDEGQVIALKRACRMAQVQPDRVTEHYEAVLFGPSLRFGDAYISVGFYPDASIGAAVVEA